MVPASRPRFWIRKNRINGNWCLWDGKRLKMHNASTYGLAVRQMDRVRSEEMGFA